MGRSFDAICMDCGHRVRIDEGGGFMFDLFYCDRCGLKRRVDRVTRGGPVEPFDRRCRCGGLFAPEGRPRCPRCGSTELREAENSRLRMYD